MKNAIILNLVFLLVVSATATAQIRHVPDEYNTIQTAINDCNDGDTVIVSPGIYCENVNFQQKGWDSSFFRG